MILLRIIVLVAILLTAQGCSPGPADVMFVLTSNDTLDKISFDQKIRVVEKFSQSVNIGPDDVRVGLITEYDFADLEFHMNDHMDKPELSLAILFTYFVEGSVPAFGSGLHYINEYGIDNSLGGRPGVPDIVVFLTDGVPGDSSLAQIEAQKLSKSGVTVIAVGGGDKSDLINLASGCHYIVQSTDFSLAEDLALPTVNLTCDAVNGVPVDECDCELTADIVFLLDASLDQGKANYIIQKQFAEAVAEEFNIAPNETRIAAVTYADFKHPQFGLDAHKEKQEAALALNFLPYQGDAGRHVEVGLDYINANMTSIGGRNSVEKIVILTSTGPLSSSSQAYAAARRLKDKGFTILSVDIGSANQLEIAALASNSDYFKYYPTFNALLSGAPSIGKLLCQSKSLRSTIAPFVSTPDNSCTGSAPCQNGGKCIEAVGVKVCQCPPGYSGDVCQNVVATQVTTPGGASIKFCSFNPCYNGGSCVVIGDMYECRCTDGFTGLTCNDRVSTTAGLTTPVPTTKPTPTTRAPTTTKAPTTTLDPNACPVLDSTYWPCKPTEVVFMMEYGRYDVGSTIDHEGDFFKNLLNEYQIDSQHIRVGVVVYHDTVREVVHLDDFENDRDGLKARITQLNNELRPSGTPDYAKALDYVRLNSFTGARPGAQKMIISVVHQMPSQGQDVIRLAGQRVKDDCIYNSIQGVRGSSLNENLLREIASDPKSRYYHSYSSFSSLERGGYYYNVRCPS